MYCSEGLTKMTSMISEKHYVNHSACKYTSTKCISPQIEAPIHTLAASVLPLVSHFEYMPNRTEKHTDRQTDRLQTDALHFTTMDTASMIRSN